MRTTMKERSEKLYDPCSLDVHFCHAKSLCDKHFPIVLKVQIPPSRHYGVLFPGQSHLCFPSMSIKTMRHYLSSVVHFKFSDLSECCKKFLPTQTHLALFKRSVDNLNIVLSPVLPYIILLLGSSCSCSSNLVLLDLSSILAH